MTTRTMPARTAPPPAVGTPRRDVELILARAHLRLGSLALARVELETLAGLGRLDATGLVDLAEVRWRTGDLGGAGEAAGAALRLDERQPVALIIAAEAAAAVGRPSESRRLAAKAVECLTDPIDVVFAGMPRSGAWPADAAEPPPTAGTLFHQERIATAETARSGDEHGDRRPATGGAAGTTSTTGTAGSGETTAGLGGGTAGAPAAAMTLGFWDGDDEEDPAAGQLPDPAHELDAGRAALVAGKHDEAALRLGIALRLAPALAPAILEATEGARSPAITVLRGDAYRLAGYETEAQRAYAIAARGGLPDRRHRSRRTRDMAVEATPVAAFDEAVTAPAESDGTPAAEAAETPETPEAVETTPAETVPVKTDRTPDDVPAPDDVGEPVPPDRARDADAAQDDAPA